jgi:hypothetical protein
LNVWGSAVRITAPDADPGDELGYAQASLSGDYLAVGAPHDDEAGSNAGAVYVFQRISMNMWGSVTKVLPPEPQADANFGFSVSTSATGVFVVSSFDYIGSASTTGAV